MAALFRTTVRTMPKISVRLALTAAILFSLLWQPKNLRAEDDQYETFYFHSPVPLGLEAIRVMPKKKMVYLLASAENQTLDGLQVNRAPHVGRVSRSDGSPVKTYPSGLDFRVTATALPNDFKGVDQFQVTTHEPMNDFLLGLKFKLKAFRGLKMVELTPANVKLIGVPSYQSYEERVYRVSFDTPNLPVDVRLVLEVYAADGTRLTRFHLEML
jgi:hypothetical protein